MRKARKIWILLGIFLIVACCILVFSVDSVYRTVRHNFGDAYYLYFILNFDIRKSWLGDPKEFCDGSFVAYGREIARLKQVVYVPDSNGGKFQIPCKEKILYKFNDLKEGNHLNKWVKELEFIDKERYLNMEEKERTTIAVHRYEYANFFHQMTDYYNAYAVMKLFDLNPNKLDILIVDKRPPNVLEKVWFTLFPNVTLAQNLKHSIAYRDIIWSPLGYNSPLNFHSMNSLPYVTEFSDFVKTKFDAKLKKPLDCLGLSILFIWRRDYVAHPGNPTGLISRKIENEQELTDSVQQAFPSHTVAGIQLDDHTMRDQVQLIAQTDILIAMHGAGAKSRPLPARTCGVARAVPNVLAQNKSSFPGHGAVEGTALSQLAEHEPGQ